MSLIRKRIVQLVGLAVILGAASLSSSTVPLPQLGDPLPNLSASELTRFTAGLAVFSRDFTPQDGLGPHFNNTSCAQCHEAPVVGGTGENEGDVDIERHATAGDQPSCNELAALGGPVFRQQTTGPALFPIPADFAVNIGIRGTPALFGFGLVEAIPEASILSNVGRRGGRAAVLADGRIGRFGRKATDADLVTFVTGAFDKEQGVIVPDELSPADRDLTVDFIRFLAPPSPPEPHPIGQAVFQAIGCAECHTPKFVTRSRLSPALNGKTVYVYSDLLLHDLGPGLADLCKGVAGRAEFRTEPLMGLRTRSRFLHDGRALTIESAIAQHGGQAEDVTAAFFALSNLQRAALMRFLKAL